ncbi:N-acetylglucosamine-6-phosphate deacetylase [Pseudonocardia nigra]|uniref:N-acetylglucosamine-6-phosphate deacetylase n=1 Tax=Pseudonocardia nigra TaxID=1921578 RepID=UPI001C5D729A|nr:amidohydrolase family protein [Pseudonocardia nigra]
MNAVNLWGRDPATGRVLDVVTDGPVVAHVQHVADPADDVPWLLPGLVDLQVNGYGGHDVNGPDVTPDAVVALVRALARAGTTTVVPTVITAAEEDIVRSLRAIAEARARDKATRRAVPCVHVEGPHISPEDGPRGVHPAAQVRPPDPAEFDRWQRAADGLVGIVTLSPHHPEAVAYTEHLTRAGAVVAIGHTHATPEQVRAVVDAGALLSTHLGNGAHAMLPRHPNHLWAQLADDRLTAGFIADGHHLPADTLTAMLRAKGLDRAVLVSDSVALAGMPPGEYTTPVGGSVVLSADGRLSEAGTPYLAGAARSLADGVAQVARLTGIPFAAAVRLATANPGRFVGGRGRLTPGAQADLLLADHSPGDTALRIRRVVAGGEVVA